jgi:glycosyltransferase involved in cell wall biosynthesis
MVVPFGIERTDVPGAEERKKCHRVLEQKHGIAPGTKIVLFNGTLDYEPNALALVHIVQHIIPELERITGGSFIVLVTGRIEYREYRYLRELSHPRYTYAGSVDDIDTYFMGADIFINPLVKGGGVKVKLVEALSFGLPVVSYQSGARGIEKDITGDNLTIVSDGNIEKFAASIAANWDHQGILPTTFFSKYSWQSITREVAKRIEQL